MNSYPIKGDFYFSYLPNKSVVDETLRGVKHDGLLSRFISFNSMEELGLELDRCGSTVVLLDDLRELKSPITLEYKNALMNCLNEIVLTRDKQLIIIAD